MDHGCCRCTTHWTARQTVRRQIWKVSEHDSGEFGQSLFAKERSVPHLDLCKDVAKVDMDNSNGENGNVTQIIALVEVHVKPMAFSTISNHFQPFSHFLHKFDTFPQPWSCTVAENKLLP